MPCIPPSCQGIFSWMKLKREEKSSCKDIFFRFSKKTDPSLFNKIRAFKKEKIRKRCHPNEHGKP
jgi:hypothetical protein